MKNVFFSFNKSRTHLNPFINCSIGSARHRRLVHYNFLIEIGAVTFELIILNMDDVMELSYKEVQLALKLLSMCH